MANRSFLGSIFTSSKSYVQLYSFKRLDIAFSSYFKKVISLFSQKFSKYLGKMIVKMVKYAVNEIL